MRMSRPTAGQLLWAVLIFACFFGLASVGQYLFVKRQVIRAVYATLAENATKLNRAIAFDDGVDLERFNRAFVDVGTYIVVLADGSILDIQSSSGGYLRGLLPPVRYATFVNDATERSIRIANSAMGKTENWTIRAKRFDGGVALLGVSDYDRVSSPSELLGKNLVNFGDRLADAEKLNPSAFDNAMHWAIIADDGEVITATGRLPLMTDPMAIGKQAGLTTTIREFRGKPHVVLYAALTDAKGREVGTLILPQDISKETTVLRQELLFQIAVAVASFLLFLILAAWYSSRHEREKRMLKNVFQKYLSPRVMNEILREPIQHSLGGLRREVTILFSDIRSFTSLSERLPPQQLTHLLQEYFEAMTEEVEREEGIVDKYIGDAIMAFWGAPVEQTDQADRAVRAARGMIKRLRELQQKWRSEGYPIFDIGIGINLGIATVGNMGSSKRFDYTVVGDTVNAASRLEQLTKEYANHIIISESTKRQLTIDVEVKDLGEVRVKGKDKPIHVFEVVPE